MIADGDVSGYLHLNHAFHETLYAHADAPILSDLAERLWLRFGPSLRVVCGDSALKACRTGTRTSPLPLRAQGDAEKAAKATAQDIEQGMELMIRRAIRCLKRSIRLTEKI